MLTRPFVVAHRGFSARYRETSVEGWQAAVAAGADLIEADLRMTADAALVLCHDATLTRLAGRDVAVASATAAELAAIPAISPKTGAALDLATGPAVPALDSLLASVPADQGLLFDIKDETPAALARMVPALLAAGPARMTLGLHAPASVAQVRGLGWPGRILGFLRAEADEAAFWAAGGSVLRLWESAATPARVAAVTAAGHSLWVTTGEGQTGRKNGEFDATALRQLAAAGVTGFLVNDPEGAVRALSLAPSAGLRPQ